MELFQSVVWSVYNLPPSAAPSSCSCQREKRVDPSDVIRLSLPAREIGSAN